MAFPNIGSTAHYSVVLWRNSFTANVSCFAFNSPWYCSICSSVTATTRSSVTQSVLHDPIDYVALPSTKRPTLFGKRRSDLGLELLERVLVADKPPAYSIVCDGER